MPTLGPSPQPHRLFLRNADAYRSLDACRGLYRQKSMFEPVPMGGWLREGLRPDDDGLEEYWVPSVAVCRYVAHSPVRQHNPLQYQLFLCDLGCRTFLARFGSPYARARCSVFVQCPGAVLQFAIALHPQRPSCSSSCACSDVCRHILSYYGIARHAPYAPLKTLPP